MGTREIKLMSKGNNKKLLDSQEQNNDSQKRRKKMWVNQGNGDNSLMKNENETFGSDHKLVYTHNLYGIPVNHIMLEVNARSASNVNSL